MQKHLKKKVFLNNVGLLFNGIDKVLHSFESRLFPIKNLCKFPTSQSAAEPKMESTRTKYKKPKLRLQQECMNKIIADEKDINNEMFLNYFNPQNPLFLVKDLISAI